MKIALVHMRHAHSGGTELFLNQLARYLVEQGEEVTIICRTHVEPSHPNIKFVVLNSFSTGKTHRMWRFAKDVEKHLKNTRYDFVYGLGKTWSHDMLRIGGGTHLHFMQSTGKTKHRLKDRIAIAIESRAMANGAYQHIVANSHKSAREISSAYGVPAEKISVIHNSVDTHRFDRERHTKEAFELKASLNLTPNVPTFLFLGTGYERKGLKALLKAYSLLDFKSNLIIVGKENNQGEYKASAKDLKIEKSCYFVGAQRQPELFYSIADCYVLPSQYEPFGFSVIEALSCQMPVIITEDCGASEVLTEKVASVLPRNFSSQQLADQMSYWINQENVSDIRNTCRQTVLHLDTELILKKNYDVIIDAKNNQQ